MADRDEIRTLVCEALMQVMVESQPATGTQTEASPATLSAPSAYYAPWTGAEFAAHPSQQQFNLAYPGSAVPDLFDLIETQRCIIEEKKSCDHCGMCRRLGF